MNEQPTPPELANLTTLKMFFVNRTDCYCIQRSQGGYARVQEPLTDTVLLSHLKGEITVGSYQLDKQNFVKWLCFDFDPEKLSDPESTVRQVIAILLQRRHESDGSDAPRMGSSSVLLEASRYQDASYHIWVLFCPAVEAGIARWIGLQILRIAGLSTKDIEVFPKQNALSSDRPYGNFVKLPFGKHQIEQKWSRLLDFDTFEPLTPEEIGNKHGLSFGEDELEKIRSLITKETPQTVSTTLGSPFKFKSLKNRQEERCVRWLCRYWKTGHRNDVEYPFLGLCIKKGVSKESANRIIREVCSRTNTTKEDTENALRKVEYHYSSRTKVRLLGKSGLRTIVGENLK
jgi:hypothetical protein